MQLFQAFSSLIEYRFSPCRLGTAVILHPTPVAICLLFDLMIRLRIDIWYPGSQPLCVSSSLLTFRCFGSSFF